MMIECKDFDFLKDNLQWTMSCSHPDLGRWKGENASNHCGVCLPCSIRRAAIYRAGIADNTIYRDSNYQDAEAALNLRSYRLGVSQNVIPYLPSKRMGLYMIGKRIMRLYMRGGEKNCWNF